MKSGLVLIGLAALAGCNQNMVQQPRYDPYEESPLFPKGMAMQAPPDGTVDQAAPARAAAAQRPAMSLALLQRGRARFNIYCAPCHGSDGSGAGEIVARGFPRPPALWEARIVAAPSAHVYDVISNGYGAMYAQGDRIGPADRWAIAAYVRALQSAHGGAVGAR